MAIASALFGDNKCIGGHYSIGFYKIIFHEDFDFYFKFAICRNPWDRLVSAFHFLKAGGMYSGDRIWANNNLAEYHNFSEFVMRWVNKKNIYRKIHFVPQYEFICDSKGVIAVDFLGEFEKIDEAFHFISSQLGLKGRKLMRSNTTARNTDYRSYYGAREVEIVAEVYRRDIELFNYEF